MNENAYDAYLRLREQWHDLVSDRDEPMRSDHKDELFDRLCRLWNRMTRAERSCAGMHCRLVYH